MFKHILILTDGSDLSRKAVLYGVQLAKAVGAELTALTIAEPYRVASMDANPISIGEDEYEKEVAPHIGGGAGASQNGGRGGGRAVRDDSRGSRPALSRDHRRGARAQAATSSSWHRTGGAGSRPCCSAARRSKSLRIRPLPCWSTADRGLPPPRGARPARPAVPIHPRPRPPGPWRQMGNPCRRRATSCRRRECGRGRARSPRRERKSAPIIAYARLCGRGPGLASIEP